MHSKIWLFHLLIISFWVGKDYLLDSTSFVLLVIYAFIAMTRTNDSFIVAYGLFQDVYAPVVEAILNFGIICSIRVLLWFGWDYWGSNYKSFIHCLWLETLFFYTLAVLNSLQICII